MILKKTTLATFIITLLLSSCSSSKNSTSASDNSQKTDEIINLTIEYTSNYCGGANPPDELLERLKIPKAYANMDIYISKESNINNVIKITADANGKVTTSLSDGKYYLFMPEKIAAKSTNERDEKGCITWKNTPNGDFSISNGSKEVVVTIKKTCDACGPLRP